MSSFDIGASRPVGAVQLNPLQPATPVAPAADQPSYAPTNAPTNTSAAAAVQTTPGTTAGTVPVDQDRVDAIRKAVNDGTYPVIPTRISDAMIAAGMMLRKAP